MITLLKRPGRAIKSYMRISRFVGSLGLTIAKFHRDPIMRDQFMLVLGDFIESLKAPKVATKTTVDSRTAYQAYDDREIIDNFENSALFLVDGEVKTLPFRAVRAACLAYVFAEIEELLRKKEKITILEVGCGNGINLFEVRQKFGDRVILTGMDISQNRITVGRRYFKSGLDAVAFAETSITGDTGFADASFNLVYSIHCLEQIAYETKAAVREMHRISSDRIVMIEPVFENGSMLQRCYLVVSDHTRILLKSIHELGYHLLRNEVVPVQSNLVNQSTLLVIAKSR
jgi:ubiquinone/menaquinone biosynthesis C-methylase UbiE